MPLHINSQSRNSGQILEKKVPRFQNKGRQSTSSAQTSAASRIPDRMNVKIIRGESRIQNSSITNPKSITISGKALNQLPPNIRPVRAPLHAMPVRMVIAPETKTPLKVQVPDMKNLTEQIKQAKLQLERQKKNEQQKLQQNNAQRQQQSSPNILQPPVQSPLNNPTRGSITPTQQKFHQISASSQRQQIQKSPASTPVSSTVHNAYDAATLMDVDSSDSSPEKNHLTGQPSSPRQDLDNSSTESVAYLQKSIKDPANAIVQHQIQGNTAKMLVKLATGEQRLVTFDIPSEDCTVHDLLEQVQTVLELKQVPSVFALQQVQTWQKFVTNLYKVILRHYYMHLYKKLHLKLIACTNNN